MTLVAPMLHLIAGARPAIRLAVPLAALAASVGTLVLLSGTGYDDRDLRLLLFGDLTFTGRTEIWQHFTVEIVRRPWLGHGFGSFWDTGALLNPIRLAPLFAWLKGAQLINQAHDGFIDVWPQKGLVDGLLLASVLVVRCLRLLAAEAAAHEAVERAALVTASCVAGCLVLHDNLESYLFRTGDPLGYLFVLLPFHAEAAGQRRREGRA
jgi:O-antigen ligase